MSGQEPTVKACGLATMVATQVLTRRPERVSGVEGYKDVQVQDLACTSPAEPLNAAAKKAYAIHATSKVAKLRSAARNREQPSKGGTSMNENVLVVSASGTPLMPCKPSKAKKLLAKNLAEKCWNRLGQFYLRLKFDSQSEPNNGQHVCLAVDTGSKWDGMAVVTAKQVLTTAELVLPKGIAGKHGKLEARSRMRRTRRYRKTPRRAERFNNRRRLAGWIAPSQKAKVDFRIKVVDELCRLYPVDRFAVEDVRFDHYRKRWGKHFSTVEIGKAKFYEHLRGLGQLSLYRGVETAEWRKKLKLPKNSRKSALKWDAHASDAIAMGCAETGCTDPSPPEFWVWKRFQYARRQLHRLEPSRGGVRVRYGGSLSIHPFRKADVVVWRGRLVRVGGFIGRHLSLHTFTLKNERVTQNAKPKDCTRLFNQRIFGCQFLPRLKSWVSWGVS